MYCVFNVTTMYTSRDGNPLGWPLETNYGYFCDQRDKSLFILSHGILNMVGIVAAYLLTVLYIGPRVMRNKKPLEIKQIIRLYNITMILMNMYLLKRALKLVDNGRSFFNCSGVELDISQESEIAIITELFLISRILDFLDTIWFVLRKKQNHISFLHVFHHSYVPFTAYLATRFIPVSPNAMSFPFINSIIHVVMYMYYFLATFQSLRKHLWWKRYLTVLQITQFVAILIYNIYGSVYFKLACGKTQAPALLGSLFSAAIFLALFRSFYLQAYSSKTQVAQNTNQHKPEANNELAQLTSGRKAKQS